MKQLLDSGMEVIEGSSDLGNEFSNPEMRELLDERNVAWRFRDPEDQNALATVDRAGGGHKRHPVPYAPKCQHVEVD